VNKTEKSGENGVLRGIKTTLTGRWPSLENSAQGKTS